jgi:hypothetical protein
MQVFKLSAKPQHFLIYDDELQTPPGHYNSSMAARKCYHCKQRIEEGERHDCWTITEAALTQDLSEDLRDAWDGCARPPFRSVISEFTPPPRSITFSRSPATSSFVRTKSFLELSVLLGAHGECS